MTAGFVGLSKIYTPEVAEAFFAQGERCREQLAESLSGLQLPVHATGMGSMMALHFGLKAPRAPYSPPPGYSDLYELVHLKMMAKGQFYARRGMINLSLPVTDSMFKDFASDLIATLDLCSDAILKTVDP